MRYFLARNVVLSLAAVVAGTAGLLLPRAGAGAPAAKAAIASSEWPQFRGPTRDSISAEKGLLQSWPEGGPKLAWKATGMGKGYGTISVAGGKIFTTGDLDDGGYAIALDLAGKPAWQTKIGKPGNVDRPGSRGTPTVDGEHVYVLAPMGELVCLKADDGKEVWRKDLQKDFGGRAPGWAYSESPLVDGDKVLATPGGKKGTVVALDKLTGATIWQSDDWTDSAAYSSVIAATICGVKQYVQLTEKNVVGLAVDTGKVLWKGPWIGKTAVIPTPIVHNDQVYITSGYGVGCASYKITKSGDALTATQAYMNKAMVNHHGGVILFEGRVYGFSDGKGWTCQDFAGGEVVWKQKEDALGKGAIAYADGRFYLREEGGERGQASRIALIEASDKGYKEVGKFTQPDRSQAAAWPHPVVAGGKLYIRDQDVLLCYDVAAK